MTTVRIEYTNPVRHGAEWIVYYYVSNENDARRSHPFETHQDARAWIKKELTKDA